MRKLGKLGQALMLAVAVGAQAPTVSAYADAWEDNTLCQNGLISHIISWEFGWVDTKDHYKIGWGPTGTVSSTFWTNYSGGWYSTDSGCVNIGTGSSTNKWYAVRGCDNSPSGDVFTNPGTCTSKKTTNTVYMPWTTCSGSS